MAMSNTLLNRRYQSAYLLSNHQIKNCIARVLNYRIQGNYHFLMMPVLKRNGLKLPMIKLILLIIKNTSDRKINFSYFRVKHFYDFSNECCHHITQVMTYTLFDYKLPAMRFCFKCCLVKPRSYRLPIY